MDRKLVASVFVMLFALLAVQVLSFAELVQVRRHMAEQHRRVSAAPPPSPTLVSGLDACATLDLFCASVALDSILHRGGDDLLTRDINQIALSCAMRVRHPRTTEACQQSLSAVDTFRDPAKAAKNRDLVRGATSGYSPEKMKSLVEAMRKLMPLPGAK
jgi:hypothetical protein